MSLNEYKSCVYCHVMSVELNEVSTCVTLRLFMLYYCRVYTSGKFPAVHLSLMRRASNFYRCAQYYISKVNIDYGISGSQMKKEG